MLGSITFPRWIGASGLLIAFSMPYAALCETRIVKNNPDSITFSDGDRVSGKITRIDKSEVEIESGSLGLLKVPWLNIVEVRATDGRWARQHVNTSKVPISDSSSFKIVINTNVDGTLGANIDTSNVDLPPGFTLLLDKALIAVVAKADRNAAPVTAPPAVKAPLPPPAKFQVGLDAPQSVVDGSSSQEIFGGNVSAYFRPQALCGPASWNGAILLAATHNRSWKIKSTAILTDTYDADFYLKNQLFKGSKTSLLLIGDEFGNSSLGMGLQQSYGGGLSRVLFTSVCDAKPRNYIFTLAGDTTVRYVKQRLYAPGVKDDFAAVDIRGSMSYTPIFKDRQGNPVEHFGIDFSLWTMPAFNDVRAIQAGGQMSINAPLNDKLTLGLTEEEDFINNAPLAKRKSYVKSALSVTYTFPAPPK